MHCYVSVNCMGGCKGSSFTQCDFRVLRQALGLPMGLRRKAWVRHFHPQRLAVRSNHAAEFSVTDKESKTKSPLKRGGSYITGFAES